MSTHHRPLAIVCACLSACLLAGPSARADLDAYVAKPDPSFAWKNLNHEATPAGTLYRFELTSQTWRGRPWTHQLMICEPAEVSYPEAMLLFITGGANDGKPRPGDAATGLTLAKLCGARVAVLPQVPNQPLLDGKYEDDLIAETFVKYLETKDAEWPLLFPMVKSAVRAMDAVQTWAKEQGKPVQRFVVTGASKRGWTTWLTGAVDRRVVAIAPMVIPTLNMRAQNPHQLEVWGKYSDQIADYTRRGLTEKIETPDGQVLWRWIDPYTYRDRLMMPKLQINGTNDPYWTLDSLNLYWDDLKGPKWVVYLPNAGHGLDQHRDYATTGIAALFRHVISGRPMPVLSWKHSDGPDGTLRLEVKATPAPQAATLWVATSKTRDFRKSTWESKPMRSDGLTLVGEVKRPDAGDIALFGDLTFEVDGLDYHLSTQIREAGLKPAP
ncbi:MAG: phenylacetic acid degradation protein [Isosphaeraceae bacterium]|nr:phenylacetic acid degradation protein [Isosphaeraceae bacterium]